MVDIINFENVPVAWGIVYGGNAGAKEAVVFDDAVWMIKYPKTTRDLVNPQISYTTSPLSEYVGSKVYEILDIPVHETMLGIRKNKIVVACKDFTERKTTWLLPFHDLKNSFMSSDLESYSGTGSETLMDEVLDTIKGQAYLASIDGVAERFWDMFVVDAFIGNNDRNNGNWGLLLNQSKDEMSLAPVFDNGNAFFNKRSLAQMEKRINDPVSLANDAYKNSKCAYKYTGADNEGHHINPFNYIEKTSDKDCKKAVLRFLDKIKMREIHALIKSIPESIGNLGVMPEIQKKFYLRLMELRLEKLQEYSTNWG